MSKRFVLSGYFGFRNFGDEAILDVLLSKINNGGNLIHIITSNPQYTKSLHKRVRCVKTFDFSRIIPLIFKSDVIISGGGSLLQDTTSFKSLVYYLIIIFLGLFFRKQVIIFAQGLGPFNKKVSEFLTANILKHCSLISVRDEKSLALLNKWGISANLVCDPIFSINVDLVTKTNSVGVQLRDFKTMNEDFIDRLAQKILKEFKGKKIEIYSFQDDIDLEVCKKFEKAMKLLDSDVETEIINNKTNPEIIKRLSRNEYLIGMRFHSIIIGLLTKTKILSINYDIKVDKISKEFNIPMIELKKDFGNSFDLLKAQNVDSIYQQVTQKVFDWDKALNI